MDAPQCHEDHDCAAKHTLIELKKIMNGQVEKKWADIAAKENEIIVKKWHDYTSKYGLGFLLTNNTVGVIFNDGSRILQCPGGFFMDYEEKISKSKIVYSKGNEKKVFYEETKT